jgi:hypothetical protein
MTENGYLDEIASLSGMRHYPRQGPWGRKSGCVIGSQDGYVTVIGFNRTTRQARVVLLLRFKKMEQLEMLKTAVAQNDALSRRKRMKLVAVGNDFVRWEWKYSFAKPKAKVVVHLTNDLRATIKPIVAGFDGRCEKCQSTATHELTLLNGIPLYICPSCQQAVRQEQDKAAMDYESLQPNYPNGIVLGTGAALLGGIAWGLVAYGLNHIFLYGAILIGYFVAGGMIKGTGKVTLLGQVLTPILTVASILFGDTIFFTLAVMKDRNLPFSSELFGAVLTNFWALEKIGNGPGSILFALIGAGYALYRARKPKFKAAFEPLGTQGN